MDTTPKRGLGFWALLALVVGNMIGSGIYLLPASLAPLGYNQIVGWLVTIGGAMCLAVVFARLGGRSPEAGGPYAFVNEAFGPLAGFVTAWSYWVMSWVGNAAVAVAVVSSLSLLVPRIGTTPGLPAILAVGFVWLATIINLMGVRSAGRVQEITVLLKLLPLIVLILLALGLLLGGAPQAPNSGVAISAGAVSAAVGLTFWGFLGLESATVPADKVENAARDIPRATLWGVLLTGLVYLGISTAFALYMPIGQAAASPAPIADFLGSKLGGNVAAIVAVFAAVSAFGTLNGWVLVQAEMPWAMARGGVFPRWFAAESKRGVPLRSHLVSSGLLSIITLMNYQRGLADLFVFIASVSLAAGLLTYLMTSLAALRLIPGDRKLGLIAVIAAGFTVWAQWGLGVESMIYGALLVAAGLPVYWAVRTAGAS